MVIECCTYLGHENDEKNPSKTPARRQRRLRIGGDSMDGISGTGVRPKLLLHLPQGFHLRVVLVGSNWVESVGLAAVD